MLILVEVFFLEYSLSHSAEPVNVSPVHEN